MLLLALIAPLSASQYLTPDAGAPGMAVQVNLLAEAGGFTGGEAITTSCGDVVVGPTVALDRAADPDTPIGGAVISTVFFIAADASPAECTVYLDGVALSSPGGGIDNVFSIVEPLPAPVDGGTGDADGIADGVITVASTDRSDGGVVVFESLSIAAGELLFFDRTDPDSDTAGNEAYLPATVLVEGDVEIDGTLDISGEDGDYADTGEASDGGSGGPGGGGGGVGSNCNGPVFAAGDGFTGGGGTASGTCIDYGDGGTGALEGPDSEHGGEGLFTTVDNGATGYAGGTGGGTGAPWGTGGGGGECCGDAGEGGFGGGGGNGHSDSSGWGGGGGGFGTDGENGTGTVGGSSSGYLVGGAGLTNGHETLVPLAGGSGGAGGDSGDDLADGAGGGGGGGALLLRAASISFGDEGLILARGGDGGDTAGQNPGSSTGGSGGSGGGVLLAAAAFSGLGADSLDLTGGYGGSEISGYVSGSGGEGRLRVDGAEPPTLVSGPTGASATTYEGPAIVDLTDGVITISSAGSATLFIQDEDGVDVDSLSLAEDDTATFYDLLPGAGDYHLTLIDDEAGVLGPAGAATWTFAPDADGDGYDSPTYGGEDCDDDDDDVYPGADEICDTLDNDCDEDIDEEAVDAGDWYGDGDGDGYGDPDDATAACAQPPDTVDNGEDCDDDDYGVNPEAEEFCDEIDNDCDEVIDESGATDAVTFYADDDDDGYGDPDNTTAACDEPGGYTSDNTDCDDSDEDIYPGADEVCDALDNDCDSVADEGAVDASTWYADDDNDGFGDPDAAVEACVSLLGYVEDSSDCDDANDTIFPGAEETCDEVDQDCDDVIDEDASDASTWYSDLDGDSFGDPEGAVSACDQPDDTVGNDLDCDDSDGDINPNGVEVCDGLDQDCDDVIDEAAADAVIFYADGDDDGYGDDDRTLEDCEAPDGYVAEGGDCDDDAELTYPGADEYCDEADNDCDDAVDEDAVDASEWYLDFDDDGYGDAAVSVEACEQPGNHVANAEDCDDRYTTVYPDATELCDGLDNDCDSFVDEEATDDATWYADVDEDGFGDPGDSVEACEQPEGYIDNDYDCDDDRFTGGDVFPGADEYCDAIDNDCDEEIDEDGALDALLWYADEDDDGFGDPDASTAACDEPEGYTADATDCDDSDETVNPDAEEAWYDGTDQDCDTLNDFDQDGDGYVATGYEDEAGGSATGTGDCDDEDPDINPGVVDAWYDGVDSDCAEDSDYDADGDGYDSASYGGEDCDDSDPDTYPGAPDEPYDDEITDCDEADEFDADGDGHDSAEYGGGDCDDNNGDVNPDVPEIYYDGVDNDCDEATADDDQDADGYSVDEDCDDTDADLYPGAPGYDEDCNPVEDGGDTGDTGGGDDGGTDGGTDGGSDGGDDTGTAGDDTGGADGGSDGDPDDTGISGGGDDDGGVDSGAPIDDDEIVDDKGGCGCNSGGGDTAWLLLIPGLLWVRRRRER
jgi:MYXO-CTERM domain-containing protein